MLTPRNDELRISAVIAALALASASHAANHDDEEDLNATPTVSSGVSALLNRWGTPGDAATDRDGNGVVDASDLVLVLSQQPSGKNVRTCPVEPGPGQIIHRPGGVAGGGIAGGGLGGEGWDGEGQNSVTVFWHVEAATSDSGVAQRQAVVTALQAWANLVQITFFELPIADFPQSIDFDFLTGNHCAAEPAECGDADCPFDGPGGVLAHAGFPPDVSSLCIEEMTEPWAGNVHFDEAETWELDDAPTSNDNMFSLTLIAAHEIGHSIGLTHDSGPGGPHIMRPSFNDDSAMQAPSASDTANVQAGYAAGAGAVLTLEQTGVWVGRLTFLELGTQSFPFDTVIEGVQGVPPSSTQVTLHIDAGVYNETMTISQAMIIEAENGTVVIQ